MICIRNELVFDAIHENPEIKDILIDQGKRYLGRKYYLAFR